MFILVSFRVNSKNSFYVHNYDLAKLYHSWNDQGYYARLTLVSILLDEGFMTPLLWENIIVLSKNMF